MAGALERARAGGAGTPVGFTVSITQLTSAGLRQEHYSILLWTVSLPGATNPPWRSLFDLKHNICLYKGQIQRHKGKTLQQKSNQSPKCPNTSVFPLLQMPW